MVVLGVFHGLCVLPVLLSIVNPASISSLIKAPKERKVTEETQSLRPVGDDQLVMINWQQRAEKSIG